jgi:hypothetical protein
MQKANCKMQKVEVLRQRYLSTRNRDGVRCKLQLSICKLQVGRMTVAGCEGLGLIDDEDGAVGGRDDELLQKHDGSRS